MCDRGCQGLDNPLFIYLFPWVVYDFCHLSEQPTRNRVPLLYRQTTPPTSHESLCLGRPDDPPNPSETKLSQMCKTLCILCSLMSNAGAFATTFLGSFLFAPKMQLCTTKMQLCTTWMQICTTICNFALNEELCTTICNSALRYAIMHYVMQICTIIRILCSLLSNAGASATALQYSFSALCWSIQMPPPLFFLGASYTSPESHGVSSNIIIICSFSMVILRASCSPLLQDTAHPTLSNALHCRCKHYIASLQEAHYGHDALCAI